MMPANTLNQYTSRNVPNAFDVLGASHATNSVTVNGSAADYRRGEYFQELLTVVNSSTSVWQTVSVTNSGGGSTTGSVFVAKTPEAFYYDKDGNLTNDGRWVYTWDAENRLVNMTSTNTPPPGSKLKLDFVYDWQGRRIQKLVSTNNGSIYFAQYTNRFVYDGWNLLAILAPNSSLLSSFVWGLDLSGSLQGAGGVGGLLALNDTVNGVHFCAYDGNGNLAALVRASDGTVSGNWEYGPFGEVLRQSGLMAKANPFRFSTKYQDDETDLLYYGYRSYNPNTGRWLNRDPLTDLVFYGQYSKRVKSPAERQWVELRSLDNPYLFALNDPQANRDGDGAVVPVLVIFGTGRIISAAIIACIDCRSCYTCIRNTKKMVAQASANMEWDAFMKWANAAKPGQECWNPCGSCGVDVAEIIFWTGLGKYLKLKYEAGGRY